MVNEILNEILGVSGVNANDEELRRIFGKYAPFISRGGVISVELLAIQAQVSVSTAFYDLQRLVSRGFFGKEAYIDYMRKSLVLPIVGAAPKKAPPPPKAAPVQAKAPVQSGQTALSVVQKEKEVFTRPKNGLLAGGILSAIGGAGFLALAGMGLLSGAETFIPAVFGGGAALFGAASAGFFGGRKSVEEKAGRYRTYRVLLGDKQRESVARLADAAGISKRRAAKELEKMTWQGLFGPSALVDRKSGLLLLSPDAVERENEIPEEPRQENEYAALLQQIRALDDEIEDEEVSRRIRRIEAVTGKIFRTVEEHPEKKPQIKSFMSYYLPTTLKLLRAYSKFERQDVAGENITAAKEDISGILDTLAAGFEQQLDKLFQADAMDISADIDVLETMMKRDGLSGDGSGIGVTRTEQ